MGLAASPLPARLHGLLLAVALSVSWRCHHNAEVTQSVRVRDTRGSRTRRNQPLAFPSYFRDQLPAGPQVATRGQQRQVNHQAALPSPLRPF